MRVRRGIVAGVVVAALAACNPGAPPVETRNSGDAGSGDTGGVTQDGGSEDDGGRGAGSRDGGGPDGGATSSADCEGLMPVAPGMPAEFIWLNRDLNETSGGYCDGAETDG